MNLDMSHVYLTWPRGAPKLPPHLRQDFLELDHLVRSLVVGAKHQVILVSPFLGWGGMRELKDALSVACESGVHLRVVTSDAREEREYNRAALRELVSGLNGKAIGNQIRVLTPVDGASFLIHGKAVLVDGHCGYLGSANMSANGLDVNVEFGVALTIQQADSLSRLVGYMEESELLADITRRVLA